jgi:EAL domain-containing protein (putative c-di-GMP-specific phosphodiesterase class I)
VCGVEALVRWRHPVHGNIPPDQFVGLAEESGLIHALTDTVLEQAARQARAWHDEGHRFPVGVNLSVRSLHDGRMPERLSQLSCDHGLAPGAIDFEITESVLMADPARARDTLRRLSDLGARLYIDDFGAGYSSLGYLKNLPVHALKIDKSFVIGGLVDPSDLAIVRATIELGHSLGRDVVAEGVETAETLRLLADMGCDEAQGYHISRPVPAADLAPWLSGTVYGRVRSPT